MGLLDVEKAFDNVWHDGLVYKLRHFDISPYLIKIIRNYLKDRRYKVSLYGVNSNTFSIPAGVPQGSLLGPVLYNIYTSDVPQLPDGGVLAFFADDTAVMVKGRKPCELRHRLQRCLNVFTDYVSTWKIKINGAKTQTIIFPHSRSPRLIPPDDCKVTVSGSLVDWSSEVTYLGLTLDAKLLLSSHVSKTLNKCSVLVKCLYPLINRRSRLSVKNKLAVYKQIIAPVIYYAVPVWDICANTHKKRLQTLQNRTLKMVMDLPWHFSTDELHRLTGIPTVAEKAASLITTFMNRCADSEYTLISGLF